MEPSIKDPPRRGHNRNNLFTKDTLQSPICSFSHIVNAFQWNADNLSKKDKKAVLKVSFIQRFHRLYIELLKDILSISKNYFYYSIRFTVRQASDGTINSVSYPADKHSVISLKKSLAQILSINKDDVSSSSARQ